MAENANDEILPDDVDMSASERIESYSPMHSSSIEEESTTGDPRSPTTLMSPENTTHVASVELEPDTGTPSIIAEERPRALRHRRHTTDQCSPFVYKRKYTIRDKSAAAVSTYGSAEADKSPEGEHKPRKLIPRRPGIEWKVGGKLEAMDLQKKWYPARIMELDDHDMEVLIHFERWSSRFDEWLDMRSERLRALTKDHGATSHAHKLSQQSFLNKVEVGTVVLAQWKKPSKSSKYPAVVKEILSKSRVNIQFYDGVEIQADLSGVQRLDPILQKEALRIWDIMKDINESVEPEEPAETKLSRRESIEAKRAQQAKMEAAEALLSKLIEVSKGVSHKQDRSEAPIEGKIYQISLTRPSKGEVLSPSNSEGSSKKEALNNASKSVTDSICHTPQVTERGRPSSANEKLPASKKKNAERIVPKKRASEDVAPPTHTKATKHLKPNLKLKPPSSTPGDKQARRIQKRASSGPVEKTKKKINSTSTVSKRRQSEGKKSEKLIIAGFSMARCPKTIKVTTPKCDRSASVVLNLLTPSKLSGLHGYSSRPAVEASEDTALKAKTLSLQEPNETSCETRESPSSENEALAVYIRRQVDDRSPGNPVQKDDATDNTQDSGSLQLGKQEECMKDGNHSEDGAQVVTGDKETTHIEADTPSEAHIVMEDVESTVPMVEVPTKPALQTAESLNGSNVSTKNLLTAVVNLEKTNLIPSSISTRLSETPSPALVTSKKSQAASKAALALSTSRYTARRHSQSVDSKPKVGYAVVLESVDAKPAKAFVVEENHNQFQCPHCQKGFRKDSLLASHVKYFHYARRDKPSATAMTTPVDAGPSIAKRRRRQRTLSICSNDSDVITPISTAPPTPLASPTPPIEVNVVKKQPVKSALKEPKRLAETDCEYDAETDEESVDDPSYQTEVVNCKCGFNEEDGLMIQCEFCCCWQHVECLGIKPTEEPNPYLCSICLDTPGVRESCKYMYNQDWVRKGSLPRFDCSTLDTDGNKIESIVKRGQEELVKLQHQLSALGSVERLLDSATKGDMYELALWSSDEETEVDPTGEHASKKPTRQERLLLHIQKVSNDMERDLDSIESKISEMESEAETMGGMEELPSTNQSLLTLTRDLKKVTKFSRLLQQQHADVTDLPPK